MKVRDVTGASGKKRVATKSGYKVRNVHPISPTMRTGTEPDVYLSNCPKQFPVKQCSQLAVAVLRKNQAPLSRS